MGKIIVGLLLTLSVGCSLTLPSFYDDNESHGVITAWLAVENINCTTDYTTEVDQAKVKFRWIELFTQSKGSRDVNEMVLLASRTLDGLDKFAVNEKFCEIKKKILWEQMSDIADATMGRPF